MRLFLHFANAQAFLLSISVSNAERGIIKMQFVKKHADAVKMDIVFLEVESFQFSQWLTEEQKRNSFPPFSLVK